MLALLELQSDENKQTGEFERTRDEHFTDAKSTNNFGDEKLEDIDFTNNNDKNITLGNVIAET